MKYMSLRKFLIDLFIEEINGDINISTKGGQSMFNSYYAAKRKTFLQILDFFKIDINSIKKGGKIMIDTRYKNELKKLLNIWHDRNTKKIRAKKNLTVNVNREIFQMAGINLEYKNKILLEG